MLLRLMEVEELLVDVEVWTLDVDVPEDELVVVSIPVVVVEGGSDTDVVVCARTGAIAVPPAM